MDWLKLNTAGSGAYKVTKWTAGTEVIDAVGKYLFPGFIDPHVHIYLPFMGTYAKDTWESASRAALVGGTTTLGQSYGEVESVKAVSDVIAPLSGEIRISGATRGITR